MLINGLLDRLARAQRTGQWKSRGPKRSPRRCRSCSPGRITENGCAGQTKCQLMPGSGASAQIHSPVSSSPPGAPPVQQSGCATQCTGLHFHLGCRRLHGVKSLMPQPQWLLHVRAGQNWPPKVTALFSSLLRNSTINTTHLS